MNRRVAAVVVAVIAVVLTAFGTATAFGQGGVEPITRTCDGFTEHEIHDGFQEDDEQCVETEFGEHPSLANTAQLLIVDAPEKVRPNEPFTIKVSTRNLVRDRFLAAADGGYYLESATLNEAGLTRGHVHTSCVPIGNGNNAPAPIRSDTFVATEDDGGGARPDTFAVQIKGLPDKGEWRCLSWAGDGSHRPPMAPFANVQIAADAVRVEVTDKKNRRD